MNQLDLFASAPAPRVADVILREEERFGRADRRTGLPLNNRYSAQISGDRLTAYERGWRAGRA
jgi:hypothetical protein